MSNNPIIKGKGVCDPHIHVFKDRAWLFASHDSSRENRTWLMNDWEIWSSDDLINWRYESTVRPEDTYIGPCERCWAVDAAEYKGKYYYYFSNGNKDTGVAVSDEPGGPYRDALGRPLIPEHTTTSLEYDPTVFVDPDSDIPYLIWGCIEGDGYFIAKLNEDMISLAEKPRQLMIDDGFARDDKCFLHKKNSLYYLSWGSDYAVSENVYGPYKYRGTLGISEDHGSFFSWKGQDFYAFTVFDPTNFYRASGLCYIHYMKNGDMKADRMIAEYGVGYYDSNWNKIQSEWFMEQKNVTKEENVWGGFDTVIRGNEAELFYPGIKGVSDKKEIHFLITTKAEDAFIDLYDDRSGMLLGSVKTWVTGSRDRFGYRVSGTKLPVLSEYEDLDLRIRFRNIGSEPIYIHWFRFC
ncbi:MAG: family 43 glycosylhydrolase [Clostridia bacterium]|nr:family 43 glycosylhydrolase [Christensenellaceae bacterium]MBR6239201.1 family 43 glycosylhydrolase [Clostridia bacterium]